jgi:hypothetical protein
MVPWLRAVCAHLEVQVTNCPPRTATSTRYMYLYCNSKYTAAASFSYSHYACLHGTNVCIHAMRASNACMYSITCVPTLGYPYMLEGT